MLNEIFKLYIHHSQRFLDLNIFVTKGVKYKECKVIELWVTVKGLILSMLRWDQLGEEETRTPARGVY